MFLEFNQFIWTFIFHIINAVFLFFILRWLLFKPIRKFLDSREGRYKTRAKELEQRENKIKDMEALYKRKLDEAKNEARVILDQANERAQEHIKDAQQKAREQVQAILERGRKQIESERKLAMDDLKIEAANLAVEIAAKILQKNITVEENKKIIDEFLERVR